MKRTACVAVAALVGSLLLAAPGAGAQDLPPTKVKAVVSFNNLNMYKSVEMPFWTETIPKDSKGAISVEMLSLTDLGLKGTEQMRLLRLGVLEFASGNLSYMSADNAAFDATDLAGLLPTIEIARKAVDAYEPVIDKLMNESFNSKLLLTFPAPPQVIYCKPKISSLADLKGLKVRVYNRTLSDFVEAIGGTPVTVAWPEVVTAFQRGTIDCGVTGTLSGNTGKWWEVTTHLYPLNLGWAVWFHAVNLDKWNSLDPKVQAFFLEHFAKLENDLWAMAAVEAQDGINCNTGKGECLYGYKGAMTEVPVTDGDKQLLHDLVGSTIVPRWAKECGDKCVKDWNATMGKVVGITASAK